LFSDFNVIYFLANRTCVRNGVVWLFDHCVFLSSYRYFAHWRNYNFIS
jgi:hypothetical protein